MQLDTIAVSGILILIVVGIIVFLMKKQAANGAKAAKAEKEGFQSNLEATRSLYQNTIKDEELLESQQLLVNLQPLTANVAGYLGPRDKGLFNADTYLEKALNAGIRSFILPISVYNDANLIPPSWPGSGKPAILFREGGDDNRIVKSSNGMQIKTFLNSLIIRLQQNTAQADEPVLVFLKQTNAVPDPELEEDKYVTLMNDIAKELEGVNGLGNYRLKDLGSRGSATQGGANAMAILLETPLEELKKKILFFTDFDVSKFSKEAYTKSSPSFLDFINFRVQPIGSSGPESPVPNVVSSSTSKQSYTFSLSTEAIPGSKINWTDQSRAAFLVASDDSIYKPQPIDTMQQALKVGVQMIPIPFFYLEDATKPSQEEADVEGLWKLWKGGAYLVKEKEARYTKPQKIVPAPANPTFRAQVEGAPPGGIGVK